MIPKLTLQERLEQYEMEEAIEQAVVYQKPDGSMAVDLGLTERTEVILPKDVAEMFFKYVSHYATCHNFNKTAYDNFYEKTKEGL